MDQDDHPFFSSSDPPPCFLNLNWEQQPMEQFDSALSSLVSSPSNPGDSLVIRELIGRLGSICNSAVPSSSSCYATPLNSPPKLHLSVMDPHHWPADPGFAHRAAKFSSFGPPPLPLSRASSTQSLNEGLGGIVRPATSNSAANARKRKAPDPKGKAKAPKGKDKDKDHPPPSSSPSPSPMVENEDDTNAKRFKRLPSSLLPKAENENENVDAQKKPEEPLKDYIHVRARRGQATDSHSLAERVRREKIGERMKFLQDLVPGCNKVTGKAVMLDEIINYVQSLQHQVEFLSMKLATVNTRLDLNLENCTQQKELNQMCGPAPPQSVYPLEATNTALFSFSNALQPQGTPLQSLGANALQSLYPINHLDSELRRTLSLHQPHLDGCGDAASQSQLGAFWEDDLQSVVQMGFGQDQEAAFSPQNLHGGWVKHKADMNSIP